MNWISNVEKCVDEQDALTKVESQQNNLYFQTYAQFPVVRDNLICGENNIFYVDILFPIGSADVIANIRTDWYMDIVIDEQIVTDIDYILVVLCPLSEIYCRFYKYDRECPVEFTLYFDSIILTTDEKNRLNGSSSIHTRCFCYENGICHYKNIRMWYVT